MRVVITGGSGLIGRALAASLAADGYETIVLSRHPEQVHNLPSGVRAERWDGRSASGWGYLADGAEAIVNLAGESLAAGLWTEERKRRIMESRVNAGQAVVHAVEMAKKKPKTVIQISGVGHYGPHGDEILTEDDAPGSDFLASVTLAWEASTVPVETMGVRRVVARTATVLSMQGGALPLMVLPFRFFIGGQLGSGRQWLSWIHIADQVGALRFLIEHPEAQGVFNLCAPQAVTNAEFARIIGKVIRRPSFIRVPAFALRFVLGELSTTILEGQRVVPKRLQAMGYTFRFPELEGALRDLLLKRGFS